MTLKTKLISGAFALALLAAGSASAATIDCPTNLDNNVSGATDCEYSDTAAQDFLNTNPITVNAEAFFGVTNWAFVTKWERPSGVSGQRGSFDFSAFAAQVTGQAMLIFKDGQGTTLVGYLISSLTGTWSSPFENPPFAIACNSNNVCNPKNVSHISLYTGAAAPALVPVPAAGFLLVGALGGLAMLRRRKSA